MDALSSPDATDLGVREDGNVNAPSAREINGASAQHAALSNTVCWEGRTGIAARQVHRACARAPSSCPLMRDPSGARPLQPLPCAAAPTSTVRPKQQFYYFDHFDSNRNRNRSPPGCGATLPPLCLRSPGAIATCLPETHVPGRRPCPLLRLHMVSIIKLTSLLTALLSFAAVLVWRSPESRRGVDSARRALIDECAGASLRVLLSQLFGSYVHMRARDSAWWWFAVAH